jgi:hypothetical protein
MLQPGEARNLPYWIILKCYRTGLLADEPIYQIAYVES